MILTCYAEGQTGAWEAICLDFDLAVQGESFDEVRDLLASAIHDYLEYVRELPEAERAVFLKRRAPLRLWWNFLSHIVVMAFRRNITDAKERHNYTLPCAA